MSASSSHLFHRMKARYGWPLFFLAPCAAGLLVFTYIPTLSSLYLSFSYWDLLGTPQWVGGENYQELIQEPTFWQVCGNTALFVMGVAAAQLVLGLLTAVFLNRVLRWQTILRTLYFLPYITPMVAVALVWAWLYDTHSGLLNVVLQHLGIIGNPIPWLHLPETALGSVMALEIWKSVGYNTLLFLAGLQATPDHLYESAALDGASPWETFWHITFPMLTPTLFFVTIITMIHTLQAFDAIYLMTQGGPENHTAVAVYWLFKNAFEFYRIGPASAIAYLLFLVILLLTWIQWQWRKRWVLYEEQTA